MKREKYENKENKAYIYAFEGRGYECFAKTCIGCWEKKLFSEFDNSFYTPDRLRDKCKLCHLKMIEEVKDPFIAAQRRAKEIKEMKARYDRNMKMYLWDFLDLKKFGRLDQEKLDLYKEAKQWKK